MKKNICREMREVKEQESLILKRVENLSNALNGIFLVSFIGILVDLLFFKSTRIILLIWAIYMIGFSVIFVHTRKLNRRSEYWIKQRRIIESEIENG